MYTMDQGGVKNVILLLIVSCITVSLHSIQATPQQEYAMLLENQGYSDDGSDPRSKFVSSLKSLLEPDEEDKRSSSFFPLRGKKMTSSDQTNSDNYPFTNDQDDKRSQFFALRGKKIPSDFKRASSFMPMRGRKDDDWNTALEDEDSLDKRASSFMPMRGKKEMANMPQLYQHYGKTGTYSQVSNGMSFPTSSDRKISHKRMSSFLPVRGKKSDSRSTSLPIEQESKYEVNVTMNYTQPEHLRNRRSTPTNENDAPNLVIGVSNKVNDNVFEKKISSFMPMSGGSDPDIVDLNRNSHIDDFVMRNGNEDKVSKRSSMDKSLHSVMPMRGKREIHENFYLYPLNLGINKDKKASFFMPMRGRRDNLENVDYTQLSPINIKAIREKKASSFMPMRGRKSDSEETHKVEGVDEKSYLKIPRVTNYKTNYLMSKLNSSIYKQFDGTYHSLRRFPELFPYDKFVNVRRSNANNDSNEHDESKIYDSNRGHAFMNIRDKRWIGESNRQVKLYTPYRYFLPAGIGSAMISRPFDNKVQLLSSLREATARFRKKYDWESVKRAFYATRGKRLENESLESGSDESTDTSDYPEAEPDQEDSLIWNSRSKRSVFQPTRKYKSLRQYLALKRPMSFFATRGKRMDGSSMKDRNKLQ